MYGKKGGNQPRAANHDREHAIAAAIIALFSLALCCLTGWGLWCFTLDAVRQHWMLTTYQPAEATITRSQGGPMADAWSGRSRLYQLLSDPLLGRPWYVSIHYEYRVDGSRYSGMQVDPPGLGGDSFSSTSWARQVLGDHPPGSVGQIWYDPEDPSHAFLIKEPLFRPYLAILLCLPLTCLFAFVPGGFLVLTVRWLFNPSRGWHPTDEVTPPALKVWAIALVGLYAGGTLLALGHYFVYSPRPFARDGGFVVFGLVVAAAPSAVALFWWLRSRRRANASAPIPVKGRDIREERQEQRRTQRQAKKRGRQQRK